jgi:hypothetical protein
MRELSVDDFSRALARYGFAVSGNRIFDVSGRCPGKSRPIFLNTTLQIDRRRTIRMAIKERADEIARRTGGELRNERR